MAKLSDLVSGLGPAPMEEESIEEVIITPPRTYRPPDDSNNAREYEQVVTLIRMEDGRLKVTKIGGIPLDQEMEMEEEEELEEPEDEMEVMEEESAAPASLEDAISQERAMRGV